MKDYYKTLGLSEKATTAEIVKSFRILAKKYHPDINHASDAPFRFREVYEAYEILKDDQKRLQYDKLLHAQNDIKNPQYSNANAQTSYQNSSNNDQFSGWTKQAEENAKAYSKLKYKDFIKNALRGTAVFFFTLTLEILMYILGFIELASIFFICFSLPAKSIDLSPIFLLINLFIAGSFGLCYYLYYYQQESGILIQLVVKEKRSYLKLSIYFIILFYTIGFFNYSNFKIKQKNDLAEYKFHQEISDLDSHLNEYLSYFSQSQDNRERFKSGIVVVDMNKKCISELFKSLPRSILTYQHDSLSTLIQLWEEKTKVAKYTDEAFGYQKSCRFKIVDFKTAVVLVQDEIKGSMPPNSKKSHGDTSGSSPIPDLKKFILSHVVE